MRSTRASLAPTIKGGLLTLAFLTLATVAAPAAQAAPARYIFEKCDSALPGGGDENVHFSTKPGLPLTPVDNCWETGGGSLAIWQTGPMSNASGFWTLPIEVTPGGTIESLTVTAATCSGGDAGTVAFVFQKNWFNCTEEIRTYPMSSTVTINPVVYLGCDGTCNGIPSIYAHYFAATESDPVAPTFTNLTGTLLAGGRVRGHQTLSVDAHDEGGGLSKVTALVNGATAGRPEIYVCQTAQAKNKSVVGTVASTVTPCPTTTSPDWTFDTQAYPFHNGANSVQLCASDFATLSDPNTTCSPLQRVRVDNSCVGSPAAGGELLNAAFARSHSDTITVGYNEGAKVVGQLTNNAGDPIAGAKICIKSRTLAPGRRARPLEAVETDAGGHYAYVVPPGPNREFVVAYRYDASQIARSVRYYSPVRPSLHSSPRSLRGHRQLHLWGQLPGPRAARRVVVLQANVLGSKRWITFRKATTGRKGRFHSRYRFRSTTRTTTYRFRALVPHQAGYPWVEGHSKAAKVTVER